MKYIIIAAGKGTRWNNYLGVPKHLVKINGETLLARTTRLLKENGIKDYVITYSDYDYSQYGPVYKQTMNDCEIDRYEESLIDGSVCFLYGDVYYTETAIKTIIFTSVQDILFFGSDFEIFAIKVINTSYFKKCKQKVKKLYMEGKIKRCIGWEMYRLIHNIPFEEHLITDRYVKILDGTDDIDFPEDYKKLKQKMEVNMEEYQYMLNLIIPCHNLENYIKPCLNSICKQENNRNIKRKAIFICDNCTDKTAKIIKNRMRKSSWDYEIYNVHEGSAGGARNVGLDHADGKYIWFIDGDDWLVNKDAIDIVLGCMIDGDMDIIEFKIRSNVAPLGNFGGGTVWNAMYSARIIGDYRFNNKQNGEDNDFYAEMRDNRNPKLGRIALAPYFYNFPRTNSLSDIAYNVYSKQKAVFAMACTKNYYKYLYVWISSLVKHNYYKKIYLIIEDDKLNLPFTNIEYINMNKIPFNPKGLNYNTGYTKATLARLYLADILPNEDKILYLDTDLLVVDNITELFDLDIDDYYAAGVIDQGAKTNLMTPNINTDKEHYINAGVCLLNLKKIREDNKTKELDEYVNTHKLLYPDQDTINVIFKNKILFLDNKYNSSIFTKEAKNFKIYHWAGAKENWVYDREYGELWTKLEEQQDPDFKLRIYG